MKKTLLLAALAPVLFTSSVLAAPAMTSNTLGGASSVLAPVTEGRWFADYDEAVKVAKAEGKDLLVDFTGSDWCGWCIKLHDEVFDHAEWIDEASKNYVFVALDFPRSDEAKALVPNPKRNEELKDELGVRGFPTIFLMNTDGVAYAQTGYQAGGPEAYVKHMNEIAASGKKAMVASKRVADAFTSAEGDEAKWAAWGDLVTAFNDMDADSPFVSSLVDHVRWGFDTDADNKAGKKEVAAKALLTKGIVDDELVAYAKEADPKNEKGLFEITVESAFSQVRDDETARAAVAALEEVNPMGFQDKELGFRLNFTAARWCAGPLEDADKAAKLGAKAMEIGTDDPEMLAALKEIIG
ncbi:Disulfide bond reductase DsbH precursor [Planctomycetes bacterium Poly30]|uniref:Disulfide bond reductase DsbH n=1 Tax=Saltatorellus ferox TaxID=2528018 RepID=A0A518F180_9BACT|nr:Disulfide bond reductase DsbH precursor [Planctomycetes bacterium Poly30]